MTKNWFLACERSSCYTGIMVFSLKNLNNCFPLSLMLLHLIARLSDVITLFCPCPWCYYISLPPSLILLYLFVSLPDAIIFVSLSPWCYYICLPLLQMLLPTLYLVFLSLSLQMTTPEFPTVSRENDWDQRELYTLILAWKEIG